MWRITTRGLTLQEVLIMAAMNVVTRTDSDRTGAAARTETHWDLGDCHGKSDWVLHTEDLSQTVGGGGSAATRKNHRFLPTDEEVSLAAIHLLQIGRKYDVHSDTRRLYASGRFRKTVTRYLPKLSQPGTALYRASFGTDFPGQRRSEQSSELQSLRHLVCRLLLEKKN